MLARTGRFRNRAGSRRLYSDGATPDGVRPGDRRVARAGKGIVYIISDRRGGRPDIARAIGPGYACHQTAPGVRWDAAEPPVAMVADLSLRIPSHLRCLADAMTRFERARPPVAFLLRPEDAAGVPLAISLGATACLAFPATAAEAAEALARLVGTRSDPVAAAASQADRAFSGMFERARESGRVTPDEIEAGVAPVLAAVGEGGLDRWLDVVRAHDDLTYQHCLSVAGFAAAFGSGIGLARADRERFVRAALAHDVGKARIPLAVLNKPGRLDPDELAVMRTHAALGHDLLRIGGVTDPLILAAARHHHEALDGGGYPDGLVGGAIPDLVRLLTICDVYSALVERRPYKEPMRPEEALRTLADMGGKLEQALVEAFGGVVLGPRARAA